MSAPRRRLISLLGGLATAITVTAGVVPANAATSGPVSAAAAPVVPGSAGVKYAPVPIRPQELKLPAKPYPLTRTVAIKGVLQAKSTWCLPAAGAVSLGTVGVSAGQSTLAAKMGTDGVGTTQGTAIKVLNSYANKKLFNYSLGWDVSTGAEVMAGAVIDVGTLGKAPIIIVWSKDIPWSGGRSGQSHSMVIYGYDLTKNTITVWDPENNSVGGKHVISADTLSSISTPGGLYLITPGVDVGNLSSL